MDIETDKRKSLRQKSPNAPAYSLQEALEDARRIFRIENQVPISRESIAEHLGLAAQSGPFNRKLSSLRQYGFLEPVGKDLRVSDLFLRVDHTADDADRQHALREALSRPTIFQGLLSQYETTGGGLPSDINLTNQLVLKYRFTKNNAETVAKSFLESARFAGLTQSRLYPPHSPTFCLRLLLSTAAYSRIRPGDKSLSRGTRHSVPPRNSSQSRSSRHSLRSRKYFFRRNRQNRPSSSRPRRSRGLSVYASRLTYLTLHTVFCILPLTYLQKE